MRQHLTRNAKQLQSNRVHLRANMPAPELVLWQRLRAEQLGAKFRRQYSIGNAIVDFYAPSVRLAIELDGESHYTDARARARDAERDALLACDDILVLRFTNVEVMRNLNGVCERIAGVVRQRATPSRSPS